MVAEVSAVRKSVDEERQRLSARCAALDREKRQAEAEARAESDRLAEQVCTCSTAASKKTTSSRMIVTVLFSTGCLTFTHYFLKPPSPICLISGAPNTARAHSS